MVTTQVWVHLQALHHRPVTGLEDLYRRVSLHLEESIEVASVSHGWPTTERFRVSPWESAFESGI